MKFSKSLINTGKESFLNNKSKTQTISICILLTKMIFFQFRIKTLLLLKLVKI